MFTTANLITSHTHRGSRVEGNKVNAVIAELQGCLTLQTLSQIFMPGSICSFYTRSATRAGGFSSYEPVGCCLVLVWWQKDGQSGKADVVGTVLGGCWLAGKQPYQQVAGEGLVVLHGLEG